MKNNCLVTVIVPCYNQARYLDDCLQSVFCQSHTNWECIIVNDCSTDNTEEIAKNWCKKDCRFHYHKKPHSGLAGTRNYGLNVAKGEFVQFLDSDDSLALTKIEESLKVIENDPKIKIVVTNFHMFKVSTSQLLDPYCQLCQADLSFEHLLLQWDGLGLFSIPIHCGFFNMELFKNVRFNEDIKLIEDWIMWLDVFEQNVSAFYLNESLAFYRKTSNSLTADRDHLKERLYATYSYLLNKISEKYVRSFANVIFQRTSERLLFLEKRNTKMDNLIKKLKKFYFVNTIKIYYKRLVKAKKVYL